MILTTAAAMRASVWRRLFHARQLKRFSPVRFVTGRFAVGTAGRRLSKSSVSVASGSPEMMGTHIKENDLVILGNRLEAQLCAIDLNASCIVISLGAEVSPHVIRSAEEAGCTVIVSPLDSYTIAKLINQAVPVRHIMKTDGIICFSEDDLVSDVKEAVAKVKIRYFPVVDRDGKNVTTNYKISYVAGRLSVAKAQLTVTVKNVKVSAGAGFVVALTGDIMTMPGLPKVPAAEKIDVDENGRISGLF